MEQMALLRFVSADPIFSPSLGGSANLARLGRRRTDLAVTRGHYPKTLPCWWLDLCLRFPERRYLYLPFSFGLTLRRWATDGQASERMQRSSHLWYRENQV